METKAYWCQKGLLLHFEHNLYQNTPPPELKKLLFILIIKSIFMKFASTCAE